MLGQRLSQKQLQKLSPQQIQLMKLLQIPTATLEQRIKEELEANPALEEGDDSNDLTDLDTPPEDRLSASEDSNEETYELDDYLNEYIEDDPTSYKLRINNSGPDEEEKQTPLAVEDTLYDHLERQLGLLELEEERELTIAKQIIGSIDSDGYLRRELSAIMDDLMFLFSIYTSEEEIEAMLGRIQTFEPPGIGARDLQECLLLQLRQRIELDDEEDFLTHEERAVLELAIQLIDQYFDEFTKKHYKKLMDRLDINEAMLREAIEEVVKLNPKPASGYATSSSRGGAQYVVPDFTIRNNGGELELSLNSRNAPELQVNQQYQYMLQDFKHKKKKKQVERKDRETIDFIKQKINSARWFIDAIQQRQNTMYRTMYTIMQYQYDFFLTGDTKRLRPMVLKDIAEVTGLDISTVSRVVNSKFVQTEFGTKSLKSFFSESLATEEGEEVSTLEVKKILEEIIAAEDKRKPLSDQKLQKALQEKGYKIARRTVAKYREQLNLPVARLRKEL